MRLGTRLFFASLIAATIAGVVGGRPGTYAAAAPARAGAGEDVSIILVGGHDSVGSLLPLPLMPTPRFRSTGTATTKFWRGKSRRCCVAARVSGKTQQ
jgi:hypothetical protein